MAKKFVILLNSSTKEQNVAFLNYIKERKSGWWHHFQNSWMIVDLFNTLSAEELRNKLKETHPGVYTFVTEVNPISWSGFGQTGEDGTFQWVKDNWLKP